MSIPDAAPARDAPALERLLKRDRALTIAALVLLCALAWLHIAAGAGLGMSAWEMTSVALFPHRAAAGMAGHMAGEAMAWPAATWAIVVAMWWVMMIAMMVPSAAPTILLFARVHRRESARGAIEGPAPTAAFAAGYLLVWLVFSIAAAALQGVFTQAGMVSSMTMGSQSAWLSGWVLILAGLYQFSPSKSACLAYCRSPAGFLARHWRPGARGALRLGARHGLYCLGCCWILMVLLFVGGAMNLAWIAALTMLVLAEKLLPGGRTIACAAGLILIAWGVATFLA